MLTLQEGARTLRRAGAILLVRVPATIMTSDWRGLGRKIMPRRSRSYRAPPACIISTAHHARPKVIGHNEPLRAQLASSSRPVTTYSAAEAHERTKFRQP